MTSHYWNCPSNPRYEPPTRPTIPDLTPAHRRKPRTEALQAPESELEGKDTGDTTPTPENAEDERGAFSS